MSSVRKQLCLSPAPMKLTKVQTLLVDADLCLPATPEKPRSPVTPIEDTPAKEAQSEEGQVAPAGVTDALPASWQTASVARDCSDGTCAAASAPSQIWDPSPLNRNAFGCGAPGLAITPLKLKRSLEEAMVCPGAPIKKTFRNSPMAFRVSARRLVMSGDITAQ